jgi:hypothetical protein
MFSGSFGQTACAWTQPPGGCSLIGLSQVRLAKIQVPLFTPSPAFTDSTWLLRFVWPKSVTRILGFVWPKRPGGAAHKGEGQTHQALCRRHRDRHVPVSGSFGQNGLGGGTHWRDLDASSLVQLASWSAMRLLGFVWPNSPHALHPLPDPTAQAVRRPRPAWASHLPGVFPGRSTRCSLSVLSQKCPPGKPRFVPSPDLGPVW